MAKNLNTYSKLVMLLALTSVFTACSAKKKVDSMYEMTKEMNKNTSEMNQTTSTMSNTTQGMSQTTAEMEILTSRVNELANMTYQDLRQGDSRSLRRESLKAMNEAEEVGKKILEAGVYYMAMEVQLWKNRAIGKTIQDDKERREELKRDAVIEYFRDLKEFLPESSDRDVSPLRTSNKMQNLYALAATLHKINPNQERLVAKEKVEEVTMLSILKEGLLLGKKVQRGEIASADLPSYAQELMIEESDAIYMLKLRYNFVAALTLAQISSIKDGGFLGIPGLIRKLQMLNGKWTNNFEKMNETQIETATKRIAEVNRTGAFLKSIDVSMKLEKKLAKIYRNMSQAIPTSMQSEESSANTPKILKIEEFNRELATLLEAQNAP